MFGARRGDARSFDRFVFFFERLFIVFAPLQIFLRRGPTDFIASFLSECSICRPYRSQRSFGAFRLAFGQSVGFDYLTARIFDILPFFAQSGTFAFVPGPISIFADRMVGIEVAVTWVALQHAGRKIRLNRVQSRFELLEWATSRAIRKLSVASTSLSSVNCIRYS